MIICYSIKRVAEQDRVRTKTRAWGTVSRLMIDATKVRWKAATKGTERELRWSASTRVKVEGSLCRKPSTLLFIVGCGGHLNFLHFFVFCFFFNSSRLDLLPVNYLLPAWKYRMWWREGREFVGVCDGDGDGVVVDTCV